MAKKAQVTAEEVFDKEDTEQVAQEQPAEEGVFPKDTFNLDLDDLSENDKVEPQAKEPEQKAPEGKKEEQVKEPEPGEEPTPAASDKEPQDEYESLMTELTAEGRKFMDEYNKKYDETIKAPPAPSPPSAPVVAPKVSQPVSTQPLDSIAYDDLIDAKPGVDFTPYSSEIPTITFPELMDDEVRDYLKGDDIAARAIVNVASLIAKKMVDNAQVAATKDMFKLADGTERLVTRMANDIRKEMSDRLNEATFKTSSKITKDFRFIRDLEKRHADAQEFVNSPEFIELMKGAGLPQEVKALYNTDNVDHADKFLKVAKMAVSRQKLEKVDSNKSSKRDAVLKQLTETPSPGQKSTNKRRNDSFEDAFNRDSDE